MKIQNKVTGQIVEANGVWPSFMGIAVLAGQSHCLTDLDSPIKWDLELSEFGVYDEISDENYDLYQLPEEWEIID